MNPRQRMKQFIVSQVFCSTVIAYQVVTLEVLQYYLFMSEQLTLKRHQIIALLDKLMTDPVLQPIPYATIQKLIWNFKNPSIQQLFLQSLVEIVSEQKEVILRLKCWVMIHLILLSNVSSETSGLIQALIEERQAITNQSGSEEVFEDLDRYLNTQVQLPFITFIKKLAIWKQISLSSLETDPINIGFSELNKIKEILQLRKIFHNYSCYYATHQYALNLFQICLLNIKCLWTSVCTKIKDITLQSLKAKRIKENQYLLIKEAQVVQDLLIQFVYGDKLVLKLPKTLLIKQINMLKPQIKVLQDERKRKSSVQATMGIIQGKKTRKLSTGTVDTSRQTKQSPRNQEKLNTEQQIEIMDSINQLQKLLAFESQNI